MEITMPIVTALLHTGEKIPLSRQLLKMTPHVTLCLYKQNYKHGTQKLIFIQFLCFVDSKFHHRVHTRPLLFSVMGQFNPVQALLSCSFNIHCSTVFPPMSNLSSTLSPFVFATKNTVWICFPILSTFLSNLTLHHLIFLILFGEG